jgi:hypothetical protein
MVSFHAGFATLGMLEIQQHYHYMRASTRNALICWKAAYLERVIRTFEPGGRLGATTHQN